MKSLLLMVALVALTWGQSGKKADFEVASVKGAKDDGGNTSNLEKGLYRIHNYTLKRLIVRACDVDSREILGGPNWLDSDSFDITAKVPEEYVGLKPSKLPEMLQSLLAERFQLAIHREPRQISGLALVVAKKGPTMERSKAASDGYSSNSNGTHLKAVNISMAEFAALLSRNSDIGQLVVDKTGLTDRFNFELDWLPDRAGPKQEAPVSSDLPSIFAALQGRLGLKLESAKVPIDAIVVDRAEKPGGN